NNVLIIFNRWGDEVFKAAAYLNDWRGQSTNGGLRVIGDEVIDGTYFYILKLSPDHKGMQGPIELIRK
ncbi:MAG: gliding motility-associated C-terminal domain-containing protein, partial [Bacteroidetes bacterium]|nr:gliding motility-associated C-terminal domain-containing protein [Bacteroidota bacterium]